MTRKKMGRPPLSKGEVRRVFMGLRVTEAEWRRIAAEANRLGVSLSDVLMRPWREQSASAKEGRDSDY